MNRLRMTLLFYIAALLCLSTACGGQKEEGPAQTDWSPAQMARAVWDSQPVLEGYPLASGDEDFEPYLRDPLGVDPADDPQTVHGASSSMLLGVMSRSSACLALFQEEGSLIQ